MALSGAHSGVSSSYTTKRSQCVSSSSSTKRLVRPRAVEIIGPLSTAVHTAVDSLAAAAGPLEPAVRVVGGDIANVVDLSPTLPGVARLSVRRILAPSARAQARTPAARGAHSAALAVLAAAGLRLLASAACSVWWCVRAVSQVCVNTASHSMTGRPAVAARCDACCRAAAANAAAGARSTDDLHSANNTPRSNNTHTTPHRNTTTTHHTQQGLFYFLGTRPNPLQGAVDFFVLGPAAKAAGAKLRARDFALRERLGGGNFGVTFAALRVKVCALLLLVLVVVVVVALVAVVLLPLCRKTASGPLAGGRPAAASLLVHQALNATQQPKPPNNATTHSPARPSARAAS